MLIYAIEISKTAVSGAWSFNTPKFNSAILKQIIIKSATTDTTFDISFTDDHNNKPFDTATSGETATGTLNRNLDMPLKGIYTVACANASTDEAFTGRLLISEEA